MLEALNKNFGLLIAFVLPGFIFLLTTIAVEEGALDWQSKTKTISEIGGLLLFLLASTAVGVFLSAIRWLVLDSFHHATGLTAPVLNYRNLELNQASFMLVVENNYRYYLFYGNTFIAMLVVGLTVLSNGTPFTRVEAIRWLAVCVVLFFASRDSLKRFYTRSRMIIGEAPPLRNARRRKAY